MSYSGFRKKQNVLIVTAAVAGFSSLFGACSKKSETTTDSTGASVSGLSSIPDLTTLIQTNSSTSTARIAGKVRDIAAVSGTAPLVSALKANALQYFWNNSVSCSSQQTAGNFWEGMGKCHMAQSVGESFGRMLEAGTSMCYMKNIPTKAPAAVTVSKGSVAAADLFKASASDTMYKISITGEESAETIFIKTFGTDGIGAGNYKVQLYFCRNGENAAPNGHEIIHYNKADGKLTISHSHNETQTQGGQTVSHTGSMNLGAYLKDKDGSVVIDPSKDRTALAHFGGSWGVFKSDLTITSTNLIKNKGYGSFSWSGGGQTSTGSHKEYTVSEFSGSSLADLRFLAAGFKRKDSNTFGGQTYTHSGSGATEWQDTHYAGVASSSLRTEAETADFDTDTFFTADLSAPSVDLSAYSCSATADVELTLNMAHADMANIQTACEKERFNDYDMCNADSIRQAEQTCHQGGF